MAKSKAKPADRATPAIHAATETDARKVNVTREITSAAKQSAGWATAPAVQAAVTVWNKAADDIDSEGAVIADLRSKLRLAIAKQLVNRRTWTAAKKQVLGTLDVQCAGSADDVKAFGFDAVVRAPAGDAHLPPPDGVVVSAGKLSGDVIVSWHKNGTRHGYVLQHTTDIANTTLYSPVVVSRAAKRAFSGFLPGAHVFFRVAAVDPTEASGQSEWTVWVAGTAR